MRFKYCDCIQVTAHHAAYPDNVSYSFEHKDYYMINDDYTLAIVNVELYSCGCEECNGIKRN